MTDKSLEILGKVAFLAFFGMCVLVGGALIEYLKYAGLAL